MFKNFKETRIEFFYAAIQHGSIRAAAESLGLAPSAVSRQIALLESELSASLFERHVRGVKPTEAGTLLLDYFREQRSHQRDFLANLQQLRSLRNGKVQLAVGEGLLPTLMSETLARFCKDYSGISTVLNVGGTDEIVRWIVEDQVDMGLVFHPPTDPGIVSLIACKQPVHAIVYPRFPLLDQAGPFSLADFLTWPLALNHASYGMRQLLLLAEKAAKIRLNPTLTTNSFQALKQFVKQGLGITFLPLTVVANELAAGEVFAIPIRDTLLENAEIHLLKRTGRSLSFSARHLAQYIEPAMVALKLP